MVLSDKCPEILIKMKEMRNIILRKYKIENDPEYKKHDLTELQFEFQNLVLRKNYKPMKPAEAKDEWLTRAKNFLLSRFNCL